MTHWWDHPGTGSVAEFHHRVRQVAVAKIHLHPGARSASALRGPPEVPRQCGPWTRRAPMAAGLSEGRGHLRSHSGPKVVEAVS